MNSGLRTHLVAVFAGAAIDNVFRVAAVSALATMAIIGITDPAVKDQHVTFYSNMCLLVFSLPMVLLAPLAGALCDRWPKHLIIRAVRLLDLPILAFGCLGLGMGSSFMLLTAVGLLGVASAFFATAKLSVLPELVDASRLPMANAWLQGITVIAILVGMGLPVLTGQSVLDHLHIPLSSVTMTAVLGLGIATIGLVGAWLMPALPAQRPDTPVRPFDFKNQFRVLYQYPGLAVPAWSLAGFWALGATAVVLMAPIAKLGWGLDQVGLSLLLLCLAIGTITGAALAPILMARKFPAGLPLAGALLAGGCLAGVGWIGLGAMAHPQVWVLGQPFPSGMLWSGMLLFLAGVGSGAWDVSLNTLLQERSPAHALNRVMAAYSSLSCMGTLGATFICYLACDVLHITSSRILFAVGGLSIGLALGGLWLYRGQVLCWLVDRVMHVLWRVEVHGVQHLPQQGGCVVAANHQSLADGILVALVLPRRTRFVVYKWFCDLPVVGWLLHGWGVIPIDAQDARRALVQSIDAATQAVQAGEVVGIFPEGKMTRSGQLDSFKGGIERIARRANAPIVPMAIDGLWRSPWSYALRRGWLRPRRRVRVRIGEPLPPDTPAPVVRRRVAELMFELSLERSARDHRTLGRAFLAQARWMPFKECSLDAGGGLRMWQVGGIAQALRGQLGLAHDERMVGVLLPPGRGGTIVNLCLALDGRTAVNLNHTVGPKQLARMCEMAGIRTIISSKLYLRRIGDPGLAARMVLVEELLPTIPKKQVVREAALNWLLPTRLRGRGGPGDVAAIVFSSGSTGDPKGVQLTHRQVLADCDAIHDALELHHSDVLLSPLPLFHSFGLVPGMWLGLVSGLRIAAHPDPTDAKALGDLAEKSKATFTIATATFIRNWMRRIPKEQFAHLRFAVAGAERCPAELRQAFRDKYGAHLLEGYGCTELAPVVSCNLPDYEHRGEREIRTRDGSVGRCLPGMFARTVHPETRAPLPPGAEGLIIVHSPARMLGYLGRPDLDAQVFAGTGYDTGDIGVVDADGFIRITGRRSRFAKIGGEMVPLDTVEGTMQAQAGDRAEVAVAAVPDAERGERLICMYAGNAPPNPEELLMSLADLPPLWRPKGKDFHRVEALPRLGTGKRDLAGVKVLAQSKAG